MKKPSFAIPLLSLKWHGGVRLIVELANLLAERGYPVYVITPRNRFMNYHKLSPEVNLILTPSCGNIPFFSHLYTILLLTLYTPKTTYIIANFFPTFYVALVHSLTKKSRIIYYIMDYETQFYPFPHSLVAEITYKFTKCIKLCVSRWVRGKTGAWGEILPPPLDKRFLKPISGEKREKFTVLYVYRNWKRKGPDIFKNLLDSPELEDVQFLVVGEDPQIEKDNVEYLGVKTTDELVKLYEEVHLLLNTSRFEGFGLPPLEAMARGTPPVLTDSGGIREYAVHRLNSIICRDMNQIIEAIMELKKNKELYNALRENAIKTAKRYTPENFIERFLETLLKK